MGFGELLRAYRKRRGWTQVTLALRVGYDPSYISRLESDGNLRSPPKREVVLRIAKALGLNREETDNLLLSAMYAPDLSGLSFEFSSGLSRFPYFDALTSLMLDSSIPDKDLVESIAKLLFKHLQSKELAR
jgi:transcriptional regulator with XRE-family HTH domain